LDGGNSEIQDMQAEAFLYASSGTTGIAASGVIEGLVVAQTSTASGSVLIAAGACVNQASLGQGASRLINPSQKTLDIFTANPVGGLPRNDIVVFDSVTKLILALIGTPNATPTDPTVAATSVALARLRHAASATTIPTAKIDTLIVATTLRGAVSPPGSATPTGPVMTWTTGDVSPAAAGGTVVISAVTLPAVGTNTRVFVQVEGQAGFAGAAATVAIAIIGSNAVTMGTQRQVQAATAQWATVTRSGWMDIPANTTATVSAASVQSIANVYFSLNMTLTRVNTT
jgi:hypothetical protein